MPDSTWLRLERQLFARHPGGGVIFAIRVSSHLLAELRALPGIAARLSRAHATMPAEIANCKGITAARGRLLEMPAEKFPLQSNPPALISSV